MRDFIERYHIAIGFFLILVIVAGTITLWFKDYETKKSFDIPESQKKIDELKAENDRLKAELVAIKDKNNNESEVSEPLSNKVNINMATNKELEDLPAIGPVYAQRIIEHRNQTKFSSVEEIKQVKGIGEKVFDQIKDLIDVN